ncbi:MAG: DUF2277 domain-containing protein [Bellilinea sp.]
MCRNIKVLYNFDPPATEADIQAAAVQYVRKISGFSKPSQANEAAFKAAVDAVALASADLLQKLETNAPPRSRILEITRAQARAAQRFHSEESS